MTWRVARNGSHPFVRDVEHLRPVGRVLCAETTVAASDDRAVAKNGLREVPHVWRSDKVSRVQRV